MYFSACPKSNQKQYQKSDITCSGVLNEGQGTREVTKSCLSFSLWVEKAAFGRI